MSKVIDLPTGKRTLKYRFFEMLPATLSYIMLALLIILSIISPIAASLYLLTIVIVNLVKAVGIAVRTVQGYKLLKKGVKVDWSKRLNELENAADSYDRLAGTKSNAYDHEQHLRNLCMVAAAEEGYFPKPSQIYHAVIVTMYNETLDVLAPTLDSVVDTTFPKERIILVLAYEERGGEAAEKVAKTLEKNYKKKFGNFILAKHPDGVKGEVVGKGGNITNAGKVLKRFVNEKGLRYSDVIVTTLDSDNRPHKTYFDQVAYEYIVHEDRKRLSYQPVSLFTNNIWDAPAVTRVVASMNSFWNIISAMRPHTLRNFASHSQPLDALAEMNFWSTKTIVEDGHQYWRSLFYFDGNYEVLPIRAPIYQDAVLSNTLFKTLRAQWVQLRRWDYGASDVAYVGNYIFSKKRTIPLYSIIPKFIRLLDGHVTLAATAPIIAFGGWVPLIFNSQSRDLISHNLPVVVGYVEMVATLGIFISLILSIKMLPPKPKKYRKARHVMMVLQWVLAPMISIIYSSLCAFYSQTRLATGLYMEKFDVTDKAVKK
ncbi:glycosyltransferase family 2 protein [Candidatus Saccharibacteria bacterium]|nr:glycosyltransferase family 2 protein [Candidatus Saccharibacteria bacterium]